MGKNDRPLLERLGRVRVEESGCWTWTGTLDSSGYGQISIDRKKRGAHRASYEAHVGQIPSGLQLDHLCRNRACINPAHLEPVTSRENVLRGMSPASTNAARLDCVNGHPLSGDNLYTYQDIAGLHRVCRQCKADRAKTARK